MSTTLVIEPVPRLVWNSSRSMPVGLYAVAPNASVTPGDTVIARVPASYRLLAARRHYLPANVPLVKRVAAANGDEVCALGRDIFINGTPVVERLAFDGAGRPMLWWAGCYRLHGGQLFLLVVDRPASFDGRYFGVTDRRDMIGKAHLLWAR